MATNNDNATADAGRANVVSSFFSVFGENLYLILYFPFFTQFLLLFVCFFFSSVITYCHVYHILHALTATTHTHTAEHLQLPVYWW